MERSVYGTFSTRSRCVSRIDDPLVKGKQWNTYCNYSSRFPLSIYFESCTDRERERYGAVEIRLPARMTSSQ